MLSVKHVRPGITSLPMQPWQRNTMNQRKMGLSTKLIDCMDYWIKQKSAGGGQGRTRSSLMINSWSCLIKLSRVSGSTINSETCPLALPWGTLRWQHSNFHMLGCSRLKCLRSVEVGEVWSPLLNTFHILLPLWFLKWMTVSSWITLNGWSTYPNWVHNLHPMKGVSGCLIQWWL